MKLETARPTVFQAMLVPDGAGLAGCAALVRVRGMAAPGRRPSCVSERYVSGSRRRQGAWTVFDKRHWPGDDFADQLSSALRHEDIDLLILFETLRAARGRLALPTWC